jgi:hypothetical protein
MAFLSITTGPECTGLFEAPQIPSQPSPYGVSLGKLLHFVLSGRHHDNDSQEIYVYSTSADGRFARPDPARGRLCQSRNSCTRSHKRVPAMPTRFLSIHSRNRPHKRNNKWSPLHLALFPWTTSSVSHPITGRIVWHTESEPQNDHPRATQKD